MKRIIICEICFKDEVTEAEIEEIRSKLHATARSLAEGKYVYSDTFTDETDYE